MRPTFSIICFTVLSGAGYGVWFVLGFGLALLWPTCIVVHPGTEDIAQLTRCTYPALINFLLPVGFVLVTVGLVCSLGHLGKPRRAWRALSQWRSSWLSREGVAALLTYVPVFGIVGVPLGYAWQGRGLSPGEGFSPWLTEAAWPAFGVALALMCVVTVYCTAHIYSSLKPVRAWHNRFVTPAYLLIALHAGLLFTWALSTLTRTFAARVESDAMLVALVATSLALLVLKRFYWRAIDEAPSAGPGHATGLEAIGAVRTFEAPNTEENYLTHEMGFVLARKHARDLRAIALVFAFAMPGVLALLTLALPSFRIFAAWASLVGGMLGLFVERWLFFAEARHTVIAYYGR